MWLRGACPREGGGRIPEIFKRGRFRTGIADRRRSEKELDGRASVQALREEATGAGR